MGASMDSNSAPKSNEMDYDAYVQEMIKIFKQNGDLQKCVEGLYKRSFSERAFKPLGRYRVGSRKKHPTLALSFGTIGGMLGGPVGLLIGAGLGTALSYGMSDDFVAFLNGLQDLSQDQKEQVVKEVTEMVGSTQLEALSNFIESESNRFKLVKHLLTFRPVQGLMP